MEEAPIPRESILEKKKKLHVLELRSAGIDLLELQQGVDDPIIAFASKADGHRRYAVTARGTVLIARSNSEGPQFVDSLGCVDENANRQTGFSVRADEYDNLSIKQRESQTWSQLQKDSEFLNMDAGIMLELELMHEKLTANVLGEADLREMFDVIIGADRYKPQDTIEAVVLDDRAQCVYALTASGRIFRSGDVVSEEDLTAEIRAIREEVTDGETLKVKAIPTAFVYDAESDEGEKYLDMYGHWRVVEEEGAMRNRYQIWTEVDRTDFSTGGIYNKMLLALEWRAWEKHLHTSNFKVDQGSFDGGSDRALIAAAQNGDIVLRTASGQIYRTSDKQSFVNGYPYTVSVSGRIVSIETETEVSLEANPFYPSADEVVVTSGELVDARPLYANWMAETQHASQITHNYSLLRRALQIDAMREWIISNEGESTLAAIRNELNNVHENILAAGYKGLSILGFNDIVLRPGSKQIWINVSFTHRDQDLFIKDSDIT